ncbi:MAG: TetR family transcriptional regulator [Actinomycetota bacterium]|nr:TetR family transcriptional regulator [Actinomycetota bacterium]
MGEPRSYRGATLAERRERRHQALIQTGLDCLESDGLSGVSVRLICARAQLTPRYFYESFADLDELLLAVVDSVAVEVAQLALAAIDRAGDQLADQVYALIDAGYGVVADDPRKANALLVAAAGYGPLRNRRHEILMQYVDLALANLPALGAANLRERKNSRATAVFLLGGTTELIDTVLEGSLPLSRTRVVAQLTAMWVAVLTTGESRGPLT